jgi:hypothetical protein
MYKIKRINHGHVFLLCLIAVAITEMLAGFYYSIMSCFAVLLLIETARTISLSLAQKSFCSASCNRIIVLDTIVGIIALFFWLGLRTFHIMMY